MATILTDPSPLAAEIDALRAQVERMEARLALGYQTWRVGPIGYHTQWWDSACGAWRHA